MIYAGVWALSELKIFQALIGSQVCHLSDRLKRFLEELDPPVPEPTYLKPDGVGSPVPAPVGSTAMQAPMTHIANPKPFSGDSGNCKPFLVQCKLHFELLAVSFPTEHSQVSLTVAGTFFTPRTGKTGFM